MLPLYESSVILDLAVGEGKYLYLSLSTCYYFLLQMVAYNAQFILDFVLKSSDKEENIAKIPCSILIDILIYENKL